MGDKSLLKDGKMLHRDISENNIIITKSVAGKELKKCLIDMDLKKELNSVPSGASHRIGTIQFMSIEVLQSKGHTYRHDLESLFYVFIWMCIRYGHEDMADVEETDAPSSKSTKKKVRPIKTSRLRGWYTGTYVEIANTKRGHMDKNGFEDIITESKGSRNSTIWDSYTSCAKSNPQSSLTQIKGCNLHKILCACYDGRDVFEPEGSEESCLDKHPSSRPPVVWQREVRFW